MIKTVSINIRPDDEKSIPLVADIIGFLQKKEIEILLPEYELIRNHKTTVSFISGPDDFQSSDLVIVIGGDGTFLRTARIFSRSGIPIFGINKGELGFLTEFLPEEALEYLADVVDGRYMVSERTMLEAVHSRDGRDIGRAVFLNDAVLSKGAFSRTIKFHLMIDGNYLTDYSGDGLIISTATGSTAYSLSAGGPIISPAINDAYIINPVCPHMLAIRPMIVPASSVITTKILSDLENLLLTIDGQEAIQIKGNDEISFSLSDRKTRVIIHPKYNYYHILREKLGWGKF